jgi:transglutaminase-like putative cysteine protease
MPILDIKHVTTYRYSRLVSFGQHRMMLLPRDDGNQKVLIYELQITPAPIRIDWSRDAFDNHVATAQFDQRAEELSFLSKVRLDHAGKIFVLPTSIRRPAVTHSPIPRTIGQRLTDISDYLHRIAQLIVGVRSFWPMTAPPICTIFW